MCDCKKTKPYHRFTLFTQDANVVLNNGENIYPYNLRLKKYGFKWKLNFGKSISSTNIKMAIESIFCKDSIPILNQDHNANAGLEHYFSEREKQLSADIRVIEAEIEPLVEAFNLAQQALDDNTTLKTDLNDNQIPTKQGEINTKQLEINAKQAQIDALPAEDPALDALNADLVVLNTQIDTLNEELATLQGEYATADIETTGLTEDRDNAQLTRNNRVAEKRALVNELFDLTKDHQASALNSATVATLMGNMDEKQIYTIRCDQVNSSYFYDSRPANDYVKKPIIYMGALKFNNANPKETFCYNVNPDIMNSDFTLYIDDNHRPFNANEVEYPNENGTGINQTLNVGITFILYED